MPPEPPDLSEFQAVLLDLDGTIYHEEHALPGAVQLMKKLERDGRPFACLTNSNASPDQTSGRLARMGIAIPARSIYTAAAAAVDYVLDKYPANPRLYNLAGVGVAEMLEGRCHWVEKSDEPCDAVLVGAPVDPTAIAERQRNSINLLRRGAELIGVCADRLFPSPRGMEFGAGALTAMLAYAANVASVFVGKPQPVFFYKLCERLGFDPRKCILIGDNLESDVAGAKGVGMKTILALTGVARREDLANLDAAHRPDWIIKDLTELCADGS